MILSNYKRNLEYQVKPKYRNNKDKSCYYADDDDFGIADDYDDDEPISRSGNGSSCRGKYWVFIAIKDESREPDNDTTHTEEKALAAKIEEKDEWVIDSCFSLHMISDKRKLLTLQEFDGRLVRFGDNKACKIKGKRTISLDGKNNVDNVYYVEGLKHNLLSVRQMVDRGFHLQFKDGKCKIINRSGLEIASTTRTKGNIFHLNSNEKTCLIAQIDESWLWHKRTCHVNFDYIVKINSTKVVRDLTKIIKPHNLVCRECQMSKQVRTSFKSIHDRSNEILDLIHTNLCGPARTKSFQGDRYFMLLIDDYSRMMWVTFLKKKLEALDKFKIFKVMVEIETGLKIKYLRSDQCGEFTSGEFNNFFDKYGIKRQLFAPRTIEHNYH